MLQDVDLADGQPMFLRMGGREIVVMDAVAFRAMQDAALSAREARRAAMDQLIAASVDEIDIPTRHGGDALARQMAESVDLNWDLLPDEADMACKHGMPEGCKRYWRNLAMIAARPADSDMVERIVDAVIDAANIISHDGYYEIDRDAATRAAIAAMGSDMGKGGEG